MAYNQFPIGYQPYQMYQQYQQPVQNQQQVQQSQQVQNGGFVSVQNESEAKNYPVAPGTSVTFRDESAPYIYTKTMGFSQLDRPVFEKFKLVKENEATPEKSSDVEYIRKNELEKLNADFVHKSELNKLKQEVQEIKKKIQKRRLTEDE